MTRLALLFLVAAGCAASHPTAGAPAVPNARPLCGTTLDCMPAAHVEHGIQIDTNLMAPLRGPSVG